jgi:histidine triad (HIT) family protein
MPTLFEKIIAGEIPSDKVYEDEKCIVIKDLYPKAKTHLLIIPRKPIPSILELESSDEALVGYLLSVARKLGEELGLEGYKLQINCGAKGGQEIFHLHIHLLAD